MQMCCGFHYAKFNAVNVNKRGQPAVHEVMVAWRNIEQSIAASNNCRKYGITSPAEADIMIFRCRLRAIAAPH